MSKQKKPEILAKKGVTYLKKAITSVLIGSDGMTVRDITNKLQLPLHTCSCRRIVKSILQEMEKDGLVERRTKQKWKNL